MAIPIEGLVSREPIQEKNSLPSKENRLINGSKSGTFSQVGRFTLRMLGSAGLAFSPLVIACSPDAKAIPPSPATVPPEASATFVPGGFGGPNPIATYPKEDPRAGRLNPIIDKINRNDPALTNDERNQVTLARGADNTATAQAGGTQPKAEGTQIPKEVPTEQEYTVIPKKYYDLLQPNITENASGNRELIGIVGKLPDNVPISPLQGGEFATITNPNGWVQITISNPDDPTQFGQIIYGRIKVENTRVRHVDAGEEIGRILNDPDDTNDINFSVTFSQYNVETKKFFKPMDMFRKFFASVLQKVPRIIKINNIPTPETTPKTSEKPLNVNATNTYENPKLTPTPTNTDG